MPSTLSELLKTLGVDAATVVAEVNGKIVQREDFASTGLKDGQSIELIRFMGGG
jgi:thiamine biosynthesis protein ThiS